MAVDILELIFCLYSSDRLFLINSDIFSSSVSSVREMEIRSIPVLIIFRAMSV